MIIGAGLAGLIAAHIFPRDQIVESLDAPAQMHNALLRFRSDKVARLTRIDFKQVLVRKGIWMGNKFLAPDINLANSYSLKVIGNFGGDRSIWNLDPVERWIAPENLYQQLVESVAHRTQWGVHIENLPEFMKADDAQYAISTMPMDVLVKQLRMDTGLEFKRSRIKVQRYRITGKKCDLYQTVYFPSPLHDAYRASITGNMLIVEFATGMRLSPSQDWRDEVFNAFMLDEGDLMLLDEVEQKYGKITPIDDNMRKRIIGSISEQYDIYSLGRFATWKNILLDDVVDDAMAVKKLISGSAYDRKLHNSK
jgi:hypothetical protein